MRFLELVVVGVERGDIGLETLDLPAIEILVWRRVLEVQVAHAGFDGIANLEIALSIASAMTGEQQTDLAKPSDFVLRITEVVLVLLLLLGAPSRFSQLPSEVLDVRTHDF